MPPILSFYLQFKSVYAFKHLSECCHCCAGGLKISVAAGEVETDTEQDAAAGIFGSVSGMKEDPLSSRDVADLECFAEFRAGQAAAGVCSFRDAADLRLVVKPRQFKGSAAPTEVAGLNVENAGGAVFEAADTGQSCCYHTIFTPVFLSS